jgi:hypothetical protein
MAHNKAQAESMQHFKVRSFALKGFAPAALWSIGSDAQCGDWVKEV